MDTPILSTAAAAKRVGLYVRNRRQSLGLSRAQLARRLGFVLGSVISHVERGDARIAPHALADWARALELDPDTFAEEIAAMTGAPAEEPKDADGRPDRTAWA